MAWTREELLAAAHAVLVDPDAVTDGYHGKAVALDDGDLVVRFTWRRHPRPFQVRVPLDDPDHGCWTGVPTSRASDWVNDVAGLLMEGLDTGAAQWAVRRERNGAIELDLSAGPPHGSAYYVSQARSEAAGWLAEQGLDVEEAVAAEASGALLVWLQMYVDNARGEPAVAHTLIVHGPDPTIARLAQLQVVADVPLCDVTRLAHHALCDAAEGGACRVVCSWHHPALIDAGMQVTGPGLVLDALSAWPLPDALRRP